MCVSLCPADLSAQDSGAMVMAVEVLMLSPSWGPSVGDGKGVALVAIVLELHDMDGIVPGPTGLSLWTTARIFSRLQGTCTGDVALLVPVAVRLLPAVR